MKEISVDEAIKRVKELLQSFHLSTFHKYREAGLEMIKAGYQEGKWHSKDRRRALEEWAISHVTFSYMIRLGKMTEEEFFNAVKNFPSVHAWANRPREAGEVIFPPLPEGKFRTIIVDPPWPVQKILREERMLQEEELDYTTMKIRQIMDFPIQNIMAENCHMYLWATQKYIPTAFEVFKAWNVKYECLLTWVKNVGFTPFSWMYSTEHVLFGRVGSLELLKKGERLDFCAKVREHSRKPDEFYELVKKVSPAPRVDLFGREKREGYEVWGNEVNKFNARVRSIDDLCACSIEAVGSKQQHGESDVVDKEKKEVVDYTHKRSLENSYTDGLTDEGLRFLKVLENQRGASDAPPDCLSTTVEWRS
jgi:N6-adenosine-specific RNA methylase IME4